MTAVAADGRGASSSETFGWTVTDTPRPPVLPNPGAQVDAAGDTAWLALSADDPDGRMLSYSATGLPPGVSLDPDTGLLSGSIRAVRVRV